MEETIETVAATPGMVESLIEVIPYAGATLVMLIIVFSFLKWMMNQQAKRENIMVQILKETVSSNQAMQGTVEHVSNTVTNLKDLCHMKIKREAGN